MISKFFVLLYINTNLYVPLTIIIISEYLSCTISTIFGLQGVLNSNAKFKEGSRFTDKKKIIFCCKFFLGIFIFSWEILFAFTFEENLLCRTYILFPACVNQGKGIVCPYWHLKTQL